MEATDPLPAVTALACCQTLAWLVVRQTVEAARDQHLPVAGVHFQRCDEQIAVAVSPMPVTASLKLAPPSVERWIDRPV